MNNFMKGRKSARGNFALDAVPKKEDKSYKALKQFKFKII